MRRRGLAAPPPRLAACSLVTRRRVGGAGPARQREELTSVLGGRAPGRGRGSRSERGTLERKARLKGKKEKRRGKRESHEGRRGKKGKHAQEKVNCWPFHNGMT